MKRKSIGLALTVLLMAGGLSCSYVMPERNIDYNAGRVPVNLPRGLKNAETDRNIDKATAVIVSLPNSGEIYVGKERTPTPKGELGYKLHQLLQQLAEPDRIVYVAASSVNYYGDIVEVCNEIRRQDVDRVGLLVNNASGNIPSRFAVELPAERDPNEDISMLKPNPLTLVVSISSELRLKLNAEDSGAVNDSEPLTERLRQIFQQRMEQHAYKPGFETRTDVPESERVEKTVMVKANKAMRYGDVIKVIDAIKGAGASPIGLQIDDLAR
jgi:biopolymer transport protein ExbD